MIADNIQKIRSRIAEAAKNCGRPEGDVKLIAVSKRFPATSIHEAYTAGQVLFGENYIQEAEQKYNELDRGVQLHFIGHLQTNKAKIAARICSMIETVDRIKLARALNNHLEKLDKELDILIQVNIGLDDNKSGALAKNTEELLRNISTLSRIRPMGLMTLPPFTEDPEDARPYFRDLRELADTLKGKKLFHNNNSVELSMGMTNDYHIAIEEGATMVRIGTAIFGQRPVRI